MTSASGAATAPLRAAVLLAGALALASGCEPKLGETAIFLEVWRLPETPAPDELLVTWLDGQRALLRDEVVPTNSQVDAERAPLATVAFEIPAPGADLERRALVLGMRAGQVVSRAYDRMTVSPGSWITRSVGLTTQTPPDRDDDGMPDDIDNCGDGNDFDGCVQAHMHMHMHMHKQTQAPAR